MRYSIHNWTGFGCKLLGFPALVMVDTLLGWPLFSLLVYGLSTRLSSRLIRLGWGVYVSGWLAWMYPAPWWQTLVVVLLLAWSLQIVRHQPHQLAWMVRLVVGFSLVAGWWLGEGLPYGWLSLVLLISQVLVAAGVLLWINLRHNLLSKNGVWYVQ